ncbi:LPS export ABC transporter permease LptF [Caldovatus aquaticus]|uniref:LPS export ABC transporter permease LptF n=1 Tax=Caldovatus aquaticus TaxID=2865671 RepID=A0ABS7F5R3_9PROT|nr:LPS export ABC transporter permease LptF [Caldovatus aquaticus]MBW8270965.1 LPS export ABC transporter permease LptF [Caldovatus aquaticus]
MTRIDRYIFRQLGLALLAVTCGLAAVVWLVQSLRFLELVLERGLSLGVFLGLTGLLLPNFVAVILPITTFVVVLFLYVRLDVDRELVVLRAAGLSQWRLARPALLLATLSAGLELWLNLHLVPLSHAAFRQWQFEIRNEVAAVLLQAGVFSAIGDNLTVYVRERGPDGSLRGILVHDARERGAPVTILARQGSIVTTPQGPRVDLLDGVRQRIERSGPPGTPPRLSVLSFRQNSIDLARATRSEEARTRDSRERGVRELLHPDPAEGLPERTIRRFRAEAHQRLAGPATALSFALIALASALTGQFRRHGGGVRLAVGIGAMVGLLALGLMVGNLAARDPAAIPLIWAHALLPGLVAAWWLSGAPGLPRPVPPRPAAPRHGRARAAGEATAAMHAPP